MKSRLTAALIGVALTLVGLLVLEGVSRALLTAQADLTPEQPDWYRYTPDLGWERRPHFKGLVAGEVHRHEPARYLREFDAQGFFAVDTAQIGPTTRKRILAIGDSNTFGWGVPTRNAYPEVLDELRADADVINLGVSGYSSLQGYASLIKHFDRVRPDVVIASFSFNDRRVVPSDAAADSHEKFEREAQMHRLDFREKIYLYRGLQRLLVKLHLLKSSGDGSMTVDARTAPTRVSPDQYRQNLERIARFCEERHVPLVFVAFQDNPAHSEHLRAGIDHLNAGRQDQAEAELRIAVNMENWFSDLARKYLAVVLEQRGATEEATITASLTLPAWKLTHGGRPLRLDSEYNDIARAVARRHGASLVEAGQVLAQDASLYLDLAHPDERGHRIVATLVNTALDSLLHPPQVAAQP
jgi:lysophospholipase L1-like esterase